MRKRYQQKKTCPVCHPNKTGHIPRWTERQLAQLKEWERERVDWNRSAKAHEVGPYPQDDDEQV